MIAAILRDEPPPLMTYAPAIPRELQRIVDRTLQKDRASRYQMMQELLADLKRLDRQLERQEELPEPSSNVLQEETTTLLDGNRMSATQAVKPAQNTNEQVATTAQQQPFVDI